MILLEKQFEMFTKNSIDKSCCGNCSCEDNCNG